MGHSDRVPLKIAGVGCGRQRVFRLSRKSSRTDVSGSGWYLMPRVTRDDDAFFFADISGGGF